MVRVSGSNEFHVHTQDYSRAQGSPNEVRMAMANYGKNNALVPRNLCATNKPPKHD